jgi:hypothetical protein
MSQKPGATESVYIEVPMSFIGRVDILRERKIP